METPTPWICPACGRANAATMKRCAGCATWAADAATPAASPTGDAFADSPATEPTPTAERVAEPPRPWSLRVTLRTRSRLCYVCGPDDSDPWSLPEVEILASADDRDALSDPDAVANVRRVVLSATLAESLYRSGAAYLGGSRRWTAAAIDLPPIVCREGIAAEVAAIDADARARRAEAATDAALRQAAAIAAAPGMPMPRAWTAATSSDPRDAVR